MPCRMLVDAVPHPAVDSVLAVLAEEGVAGLNRLTASSVLLVAVALTAAAEDQVELAQGTLALEHDLLLRIVWRTGCEPGGAGKNRRRLGRGLRQNSGKGSPTPLEGPSAQ
eukprot:2684419-Alexandrium_andersonii.AAC.1